ncbi:CPP1-like family protein [Trichothermofontia sichuanensis B231]|uniref:CPP1-like family protein n=1 Tax=Trichothermofontia sichuanensis TaxID=3045816 RepID=UPI002247069E|nr:CPP1-like family protein [Trichothermofontia sichuanensis]UZQ54421.1 CPP1-like family protein [Trichothermofontia sichuanensis B231]
MSSQNPYELLGVAENASFDEIQDARLRLQEQYASDQKVLSAIEAAYDAVLMDRLRLRQEGKIKVPDRIRFPERLAAVAPAPPPTPTPSMPNWLHRFLDTPSQGEILLPAAIFIALGGLTWVLEPSLTLALGTGVSLYFLNRKENKFGRSLVLTLVGLGVGLLLGGGLTALVPSLQMVGHPGTVAACTSFVVLWLVSALLR